MNKKKQIKKLVVDILQESNKSMIKNIDRILNSGSVDIESWSDTDKPMILPKCIVVALLQNESTQFECKGTSFEKHIKKEVKNIRYYI